MAIAVSSQPTTDNVSWILVSGVVSWQEEKAQCGNHVHLVLIPKAREEGRNMVAV